MSDPSTGITFRVIQEAMPEYHLAPDLLDGVLTAMPPPPTTATAAWRRARLARIIEELAARVPMDAAQGHLAGQIVVTQFLADDMAARIHAPGLALAEMCRLNRTTDDLLRTVARLERALERRQVRVMPFRDVGAVDGFDLDALDSVWCQGIAGSAGAGSQACVEASPVQQVPAPEPATREPAAAADKAEPEPVRPRAGGAVPRPGEAVVDGPQLDPRPSPGAGFRQEHAPPVLRQTEPGPAETWHKARGPCVTESGTGVGRTGVTVEREGVWSLEVWPSRAGAGARMATTAHRPTGAHDPMAHQTARMTPTPPTTATPAAATTDRQGPLADIASDLPRGAATPSPDPGRVPGTTIAA
jgi:hypothetical protein